MYPTTCHDAGQPQVNHWVVALGQIVPVYCTPIHISLLPPTMQRWKKHCGLLARLG